LSSRLLRRLESFAVLLHLQLVNNQRMSWPWVLAVSLVFPLLLMFVFSGLVAERRALLVFLLAGNIVLALVLSVLSKTALAITFLRHTGSIDYFATLPVGKAAFITSLMTNFLVQALPGALLLVLLGRYLLGLPVQLHPILLLVLPAAALAMAAIGCFIGSLTPDILSARLVSQLVIGFLIAASPVLVPVERLPEILQKTSYLLPTTYAAAAVRDAITGSVGPQTWGHLAVICLFAGALLALVSRNLVWHGR
jgi:ABC-2 type transport system permease protein